MKRVAWWLAACLALDASSAWAQTGPVDPSQPLPAGHPDVGTADPEATGGAGFRHVQGPEEGAFEAADLPAGVVLVRVVDGRGAPVANAPVHLGSMRDGQRGAARDLRTRPDGVAQFDHCETGASVSYRASVEADGAKTSSAPFQLDAVHGERVQIARFDVTHDTRALLISEARVEISFVEDRLVVVERHAVVNFSGLGIGGEAAHPTTYAAPAAGLVFALPANYTAFRTDEESMGDQRIVEEHGAAVFHGSLPPTADPRDPPRIVFQFREKIESDRVEMDLEIPIEVLRLLVLAQAPAGMRLEVANMPEPETRQHEGQRIFVTGRERSARTDPPLNHVHIVLSGLPAVAGPERLIALLAAAAIVLGSAGLGIARTRERTTASRTQAATDDLRAERVRLLDEAQALGRAHAAGDIGPETHARRRRELSIALARVLRSLGE